MEAPTGVLTPAARRILDTAAELFYGQGINAVGVDLIAKRSGVTKKTLYDRFGSKEALVAAYLRERDERWRAWLTAEVEKSPPADRALATFDALALWVARENPRGCGFVNAAAELPDAAHPARQVIADQKRWLREYLRQLCEEAGVTAPDELADELLLLHEGATVLNGLSVVADAVGIARRLAVRALERARA
ncbi:TetR/AcrR family transcriptional regulator [Streptomyces sp. NEAU-YJ-81]|uniref:TetR/AcrR family transcriptional regulator n=1 Tax=Streptomyces sp. NEAU-YJ-81 TaxID=2820288 RepID=UPI001ABD1C58|nr:TetR/AcrR family transcriptional regulator [Streptomyces sp. NEAU-YJ-81]MBO3678342.1 TetR/AcrR family transcriptional regulator [Streptomyces sp. NEAU-YJ-81]